MTRGPSFLALCVVAFILTLWLIPYTHPSRALTSLRSSTGSDLILDTQNATLGFQKIFVINMPSRTDKRDALVVGAHYMGLDLEFVDAVLGADVPLKAYPQDWPEKEAVGSIGTWRAHMNVYSRMVQEKIQTALILEDDADWDVMLKSQMLEIARGARHVQNSMNPKHSPYGDEWDALFVGHCGTNNRVDGDYQEVNNRYWVINNDPTVVPPQHGVGVRSPNQSPLAISEVDNSTRIIFSPYKVTCLQAYGVSLDGAARILYDQAFRPHATVIDIAWSQMCKFRRLRMPIAVHPPIMGQHRPPGDGSKDSDRTLHKTNAPRKVGYSENVNFPMRLNIESFMYGKDPIRSQYPGETMYDTIDPRTLKLPTGKPAVVLKEDFIIPPPGQALPASRAATLDRGEIQPPPDSG